jgi:hypothetical protein
MFNDDDYDKYGDGGNDISMIVTAIINLFHLETFNDNILIIQVRSIGIERRFSRGLYSVTKITSIGGDKNNVGRNYGSGDNKIVDGDK